MARTVIGVLIAAVVIYAWGFVYWGMGPYREVIWKQTKSGEAAGKALSMHFTERGTYFVPNAADPDTLEARYTKGPVAFVHMLAPEGRPMVDTMIMGTGFVLNLVVIVLVAVLLHNVTPFIPTYLGRVGLVTLAGITASVLIDGGDVVWWQIPWEWKVYQATYNISVWIIAALILAAFIRTSSAAAAAPDAEPAG
jgi:hypothetical protein